MSTYTVYTQYLENYAIESNQDYWKFKGGEVYVITGVDRLEDAVAFVASIATENSCSQKEFVKGYTIGKPKDDGGYSSTFPAIQINIPEYMAADEKDRIAMRRYQEVKLDY